MGLYDIHRAANRTHAQPIHSRVRSFITCCGSGGLLTDMRLGRRTDTRTHTRTHFSIYLLLRVRPRSRELLLSAAKRAGCPLLSCSLLSEKGLARPLMDASWILRRRGTR